jgi:hypothetical protein
MKKITTKEFLERLKELHEEGLEITKNKNADYSGIDDPFRNFKIVEDMGVATTEEGFMTRMCDKMSRIATLIHKKQNVKDESIKDTLLDLANYALILRVWLETKDG